MGSKERLDTSDFTNTAERYWYLSSIQRVARKYFKDIIGREVEDEHGLATFIQKARMDKPELFVIMNADASVLRRRDLGQKAEEMAQKDPTFFEKTKEERIEAVRNELICEFYNLSTKTPRELRLLESLLFDE